MNGSATASGGARTRRRVGFLGLGTMGGPMCRRLAAAGHTVTAYDLDADASALAVAAGAAAAESALDCARNADLFMTSLPGPPQVEAVMAGGSGALGAMQPGSVWVDLTTNSRELVLELAATAPDGVAVVDSPVTGAVDGARRGKLTLFVGGEPAQVAAVRPVLEHLGTVIECGPLDRSSPGTRHEPAVVHQRLRGDGASAAGRRGRDLRVRAADPLRRPARLSGQACGGSECGPRANCSTST